MIGMTEYMVGMTKYMVGMTECMVGMAECTRLALIQLANKRYNKPSVGKVAVQVKGGTLEVRVEVIGVWVVLFSKRNKIEVRSYQLRG
jgi:hypothetical protein